MLNSPLRRPNGGREESFIKSIRVHSRTHADGIGDLRGIAQRWTIVLSWAWMLWPRPSIPPRWLISLMISNYTDIDPIFGTLADFDELVAQTASRHEADPRLCAQSHPISIRVPESRSSRTGPKCDWYSGAMQGCGGPPKWLSHFGGIFGNGTKRRQHYYHASWGTT
jgi:alpha-glucosidase